MDYLGLFCLGVFAGTIATFGMTYVKSVEKWKVVLALSLPAVLGGVTMVQVDRFATSPAFGCYPAGLVAALIWAFAPDSMKLIKSGYKFAILFGGMHLLLAFWVTLTLAALTAVPAFLQIRAEWKMPDEARLGFLVKQLNTTRAAAPAHATVGPRVQQKSQSSTK